MDVLPFLAFEAPYFIFFLKYLPASSLSALPAVKRGCRVAGLALKVVGSLVNGLMPLGEPVLVHYEDFHARPEPHDVED